MARTPRFRYPTLEFVNTLAPDEALLRELEKPSFEVGSFCNGANAPNALLALLERQGYAPDDHDRDHGMLFASPHGVAMHVDERPAVLWVLAGPQLEAPEGLQLLVGSRRRFLREGDVLLFDSRKEHGVISTEAGLWAVFSMYVRRARSSGVTAAPQ